MRLLTQGDRVGGRYALTALLGRGDEGDVWAAEDSAVAVDHAARQVAVKVLRPEPDPARRRMLARGMERVAWLTERIAHRHVCRLIDHGASEAAGPYLVYERMYGETLDDRLRRDVDLTFGETAPVLAELLEGLSAVHAAGVVHCDITPTNVYLARDGEGAGARVVITDFGVARPTYQRARENPPPGLLNEVLTGGTLSLMAPEQIVDLPIDPRADLYAAGLVAFLCLSGRLPFESRSIDAMLGARVARDAPSLSDTTGEPWPEDLEAFLARCLARDRVARFGSAGEALSAWRAVCAAHGAPLA